MFGVAKFSSRNAHPAIIFPTFITRGWIGFLKQFLYTKQNIVIK